MAPYLSPEGPDGLQLQVPQTSLALQAVLRALQLRLQDSAEITNSSSMRLRV